MHSLLAPGITLVLIPLFLRALPAEPAAMDDGALPAAPGPVAADLAEAAPLPPVAEPRVASPSPAPPAEAVFVGADRQRITVARLARFLASHGSPLAVYADRIVAAGVRHGVDPRWVVAIAGTETYFGRYHKGHNAWGWDAPNGLRRWASWEEAIESYTLHFARGYRSRDPLLIGARYAPFAPHWPETTRLFFSRI